MAALTLAILGTAAALASTGYQISASRDARREAKDEKRDQENAQRALQSEAQDKEKQSQIAAAQAAARARSRATAAYSAPSVPGMATMTGNVGGGGSQSTMLGL